MRILLIGGSFDGDRVEVRYPPLPRLRRVPPPSFDNAIPVNSTDFSISGNMTVTEEIYVLETFSCGGDYSQDQLFFIYRHTNMTMPDLVKALIEGYRRKSGR